MGYIRHDAIIVTAFDMKYLRDVHTKAKEIELAVSEIVSSPVNGYVSFLVAPDGSKEGWAESDKGDNQRAEFIAWLRGEGAEFYCDWALVSYGGDSDSASVMDHDSKETP